MVFSGYLTKRGSLVPSWKRRYFELDVNVLSYYEHEGGEKKGELIITPTSTIREQTFVMLENTFHIQDDKNETVLYLSADSEVDKSMWMNALNKTIERLCAEQGKETENKANRKGLL
jgi:hypothetical protein